MQLIDKYIINSSILALFTEAFSFHYLIDWKLFYVILVINFLVFSYKYKVSIHKNILVLILFFLGHGIVNYLFFSNPIQSLFSQIIGISFSSIYYYNILKNYGSKILFNTYLNIAFGIALLAIPMYYLEINSFIHSRLNGVMSEPAHYAAILLPATYVFFREKIFIKASVVLFTIILTKSSIGFIGLGLMLIMPLLKVKHLIKYSIITIIVLGFSAYYIHGKWSDIVDESNTNQIVRRVKETKESIKAIETGKFPQHTNLSSYAFISNTFITKEIFYQYPLGTGIGSYMYEYDKNYNKLNPPEYLLKLNQSKINKTDANSLFLRLTADLGIFGLLIILYFFARSFSIFRKDKRIVQQGTFFYLTVKLIREGHYFPPEFYFFLLIFLKDFDEGFTHS